MIFKHMHYEFFYVRLTWRITSWLPDAHNSLVALPEKKSIANKPTEFCDQVVRFIRPRRLGVPPDYSRSLLRLRKDITQKVQYLSRMAWHDVTRITVKKVQRFQV